MASGSCKSCTSVQRVPLLYPTLWPTSFSGCCCCSNKKKNNDDDGQSCPPGLGGAPMQPMIMMPLPTQPIPLPGGGGQIGGGGIGGGGIGGGGQIGGGGGQVGGGGQTGGQGGQQQSPQIVVLPVAMPMPGGAAAAFGPPPPPPPPSRRGAITLHPAAEYGGEYYETHHPYRPPVRGLPRPPPSK